MTRTTRPAITRATRATARRPKALHTEEGSVELDVPRDRAGDFEPAIVPKGVRRLEGLSARVIAMYADGMTVRDIADQLAETLAVRNQHAHIAVGVDVAGRKQVLASGSRPTRARSCG